MSKAKTKKRKHYKPFERPRLASCVKDARPRWLIMEPAPLAAVCAVCCAFIVLLIQLIRQLGGAALSPGTVTVSVGLSFVVSYTLVGCFIYYVLRVVDREIWSRQRAEAEAAKAREREAREAAMEAAMEAAATVSPESETPTYEGES